MIDFNCHTDYILEDDRVLLRPLEEDDFDWLLSFALHEPELWTYSLVSPAGAAGMQTYVLQALQARNQGKEYPFIVYDKLAKQYAGCTRYYDLQLQYNTLQLGYTWYGKAFQRTGLNRHCKYLLLSFAFENIGMERVEFRADVNNAKSIAAMQNIGCTVEGVLRSHMPTNNGTRRDSIILSILRQEWFDTVKEALKNKLY